MSCHVTCVHESCHTYQWVMPHVSTSHVTHINESYHTYQWVMPHIWTSHWHVWHDSLICVTWHERHELSCRLTRIFWNDVTDMTVWTCVVSCHTHINESCHIHQRVMQHISTSHITHCNTLQHTATHCNTLQHIWTSHITHYNDSRHVTHFTYINESCYTYPRVVSQISTSHITDINESCYTYQWVISQTSTSHMTHINESRHVTHVKMRQRYHRHLLLGALRVRRRRFVSMSWDWLFHKYQWWKSRKRVRDMQTFLLCAPRMWMWRFWESCSFH